MKTKLSHQQLAMLRSIAETGDPLVHVSGQAAHGGASGTLSSLKRRGLITWDVNCSCPGWCLTPTGREVLIAARRR